MARLPIIFCFITLALNDIVRTSNFEEESYKSEFRRINIHQFLNKVFFEQIQYGDKCISKVDFFKWNNNSREKENYFPVVDLQSDNNANWAQEVQACNIIFISIVDSKDVSLLDKLYDANLKQKHKLIVLNMIADSNNIIDNHIIFSHLLFSVIIWEIDDFLKIKISEFTPKFHWALIPPFESMVNSATLFRQDKLFDMKGKFTD